MILSCAGLFFFLGKLPHPRIGIILYLFRKVREIFLIEAHIHQFFWNMLDSFFIYLSHHGHSAGDAPVGQCDIYI